MLKAQSTTEDYIRAKWEEDKAERGRGGKTISGNGQAWSFSKPQRAVENREKMEETGGKIICGAPTTLAVNG